MLAETRYNWDDLEVGRFDLNHSEHFFTQKHIKHENFPEDFSPIKAMAALNINESFSNNIDCEDLENKENNEPVAPNNKITIDHPLPIAKGNIKQEKATPSPASTSTSKNTPHTETLSGNSNIKTEKNNKPCPVNIKSPTSPCSSNGQRRPANLLTKFKTPPAAAATALSGKNVKGTVKVEPPHAYDFKDIYKKKKEEMMKKLLEEERKNRVFHSRPVPKSVVMPTVQQTKQLEHHLTCPKTPLVLKHSQEAEEKRRQRLEEYKRKNQPQKLTIRKPPGQNEEPFKPKKTQQIVLPQPFKLSVERRLEERKQYDEQNRIAAEEKKKQEEEERKKREEELVKELRKLASFKARPNPFK